MRGICGCFLGVARVSCIGRVYAAAVLERSGERSLKANFCSKRRVLFRRGTHRSMSHAYEVQGYLAAHKLAWLTASKHDLQHLSNPPFPPNPRPLQTRIVRVRSDTPRD